MNNTKYMWLTDPDGNSVVIEVELVGWHEFEYADPFGQTQYFSKPKYGKILRSRPVDYSQLEDDYLSTMIDIEYDKLNYDAEETVYKRWLDGGTEE